MSIHESSLTDDEYSEFLNRYFKPSVIQFVGRSLLSTLIAFILTVSAAIYWHENQMTTWILAVVAVVSFAVHLRFQENLVHSGSHYCVSHNPVANDLLVNIFAGLQVAQQVKAYRLSHSMHHTYFGSDNDPCKARYENQHRPLRNMLSMTLSFYQQINANKIAVLMTVLYYTGLYALVVQTVSVEIATRLLMLVLMAFFLVLPVIRYIAEMAEHDYALSDSEFGSTFNNLSVVDRWLFHPAADGYHLLHHLYPAIPFWQHKKAHRFLMERDEQYVNGHHKTSTVEKFRLFIGEKS
ncbi:fatty acid desaturase [Vibrio rhizosphaerae]|uniref:Fatty acid desaturase n=1 Tax=Vibrio rhizosphaerae TaxID=398736 RepID=A0ABU4IP68_9VIBR|nr:fatty acid desaturase [Vibrio rhizosphaerae]MDW6091094.1 fatty acid desaturase [Vibrio rhizosphaerae]